MQPAPEIIIAGCGRSGTTLLYEILARHPGCAWFSSWGERFGIGVAAPFNRLFRSGRTIAGHAPIPSEAYRTWQRSLRLDPVDRLRRVGPEALDGAAGRRLARAIANCRRFGGGSVFLNKNTGNTRRLDLLAAIFPSALLVHVVRSPLDTVASLLTVPWWPTLELWTHAGATPEQLAADPVASARLAAELWLAESEVGFEAAAANPDRSIRVDYEQLVDDPRAAIEPILDATGLEWADLPTPQVRSSSIGRHRSILTAAQIEAVQAMIEAWPLSQLAAEPLEPAK